MVKKIESKTETRLEIALKTNYLNMICKTYEISYQVWKFEMK